MIKNQLPLRIDWIFDHHSFCMCIYDHRTSSINGVRKEKTNESYENRDKHAVFIIDFVTVLHVYVFGDRIGSRTPFIVRHTYHRDR